MKRFQVPEKLPKTPTTENKSIRFPISMIREVEAAIQGKNSSFFRFRHRGHPECAGRPGRTAGKRIAKS